VSARGFSLLEVSLVLIVMGITAAGVIPALRTIDETRRYGAAEEVERRLTLARARAIVLGRPVGVSIDPSSETLRMMTITSPGAAPGPLAGVLGEVEAEVLIASLYPGCEIVSCASGGASTGAQTIWFDVDGTPHTRSAAGVRQGAWSSDATIVTSGNQTITIRRLSGAIQR
jgi:prepilin-type N-terminal cleavage/methylation domain-containing protein